MVTTFKGKVMFFFMGDKTNPFFLEKKRKKIIDNETESG